jgi:hypothetical protein
MVFKKREAAGSRAASAPREWWVQDSKPGGYLKYYHCILNNTGIVVARRLEFSVGRQEFSRERLNRMVGRQHIGEDCF